MENKQSQKESNVHNTSGGEMPDPKAINHGDTEKQIREAFAKDNKKRQVVAENHGDKPHKLNQKI